MGEAKEWEEIRTSRGVDSESMAHIVNGRWE